MKTPILTLLFLCLIGTLSAQVHVVENGDVGIKKADPEHELDVEGVTRSSEYFEGVYGNKEEVPFAFQRILFPEGTDLSYNGDINGPGVIKIALPLDWSNHIVKFSVEVSSYRYNKAFSLEVAGYPYAGNGTGGYWFNTSASMTGGTGFPQMPVRFGHDGTKPCVLIGNADTEWTSSLNVTISDLYVRPYYDNPLEEWTSGWDISVVSSLPSNIDQQHFLSTSYQSLHALDTELRQTAKFFFNPGNQAINSTRTIGKLHLPSYYTFSFKVTVSSSRGLIAYLFTGYGNIISKNLVEATPRGANAALDELVDVDIEYNTTTNEATIQIINNDQNYPLYEQNIIVESYSRLAPPYFTALDENTTITPFAYQSVQNTAIGKWENTDNSVIHTLDRTIARTGDVFINSTAKGVIIRDQTNSNCYRIISNNGVLSTELVACPQ